MDDLTRLPAARLAEAICTGRHSARAVVDAFLDRITAADGLVQAYIEVLADRARGEARARDDEQRAGRLRGPLHGVPVAIKDLMTVAGVSMTAGSVLLDRAPATEDAAVVARLRDAGAIVLGLTTLNEFALGTTGVNPHSRTARNPWNLERITGGSSSGSGAAVAAGLAPAAIGTDTGGSIRIPAALCGIVGLKPTFGRVSRAGVFPLAGSFDTVGPMVRTVEDAALMLEVIAGHDPADASSLAAPVGRYRAEMASGAAGLTAARLAGPFFDDGLDPAGARALDETAHALERHGVPVRPVSLPGVEAGHEAQLVVLWYEAARIHRKRFAGREAGYNPDVRTILDQGASITAAEAAAAHQTLARFRVDVAALLQEHPVLLAPAVPMGAPSIADADPHGPRWPEIRRQVGRFTRIFNATGMPTIVLPAGLTREGLPVGVQLAAAALDEGRLLAVSHKVEAALGWSIPDLPHGAGGRV